MRRYGLCLATLVALGCGSETLFNLEFVDPLGSELSGYVDLEVAAPDSATAVRFYLDGVQLAELTDIYATRVRVNPRWRTGTDLDWFAPGEHKLRAEAETSQGVLSIEKTIQTSRSAESEGVTSLTGAWRFAALPYPAPKASRIQKLVLEPGFSARTHVDIAGSDVIGVTPKAVQPNYDDSSWSEIVVPSSFGAVDDQWNSHQGTVGVYRRKVSLTKNPAQRIHLVLESCYFLCRVFVNGTEVGRSIGAYWRTQHDITAQVISGENLIAVMTDNRLTTMGDFSRAHRYLWNYGGILQQLRLETTGNVAVTGARTAVAESNGSLVVAVKGINVTGAPQAVGVQIQVRNPQGAVVQTSSSTVTLYGVDEEENISLSVPSPQLWTPNTPALYTIQVTPTVGRPLTFRTGFRTVSVGGTNVLVNGQVVSNLQGYTDVADIPGLGRTRPDGLARRQLAEYRAAGFNLVRGAYHALTPAFLDAADELGVFVIEELNVTGMSTEMLAKDTVYGYGHEAGRSFVDRDSSHPSILAWSLGAENATTEIVATNYFRFSGNMMKEMDSTWRLVTHVSNAPTTDVVYPYDSLIMVNSSAGWSTPNVTDVLSMLSAVEGVVSAPILLSSYGGEGVLEREGSEAGSEYFQSKLVDDFNRILRGRPNLVGKIYSGGREFLATPDWSGGNPDPVAPYNVRGLISRTGKKKLAWKTLFAPVRLSASSVHATANVEETIQQRITVTDALGAGANGSLLISAPHGFTAEPTVVPFNLGPNGSTELTVSYRGSIRESVDFVEGRVRAVISEDVEAHPLLVRLERADSVQHPATENFFDTTVNRSRWDVVREDNTGWNLNDRLGFLRLSTLPGTLLGATNTIKNLFINRTDMEGDFTAIAAVEGEVSLFVYKGEDDYVRLGVVNRTGIPQIEFIHEYGGVTLASVTSNVSSTNARLRLERRGERVSAQYSLDGAFWYTVGVATPPAQTKIGTSSLAGALRVALAASADATGGAVRTTYVDRLQVLVSGRVEVNHVAAGEDLALTSGETTAIPVSISNWGDKSVRIDATLVVPRTWTRDRVQQMIAPYTTTTVLINVRPPLRPEVATLRALVTAEGDFRVFRNPRARVLSIPPGARCELALDAGREDSLVQTGYQRLSASDTWDANRGYGWISPPDGVSNLTDIELAKLDPIRQDLVFSDTKSAVLRLFVPPGLHKLFLLTGHASSFTKNTVVEANNVRLGELGEELPKGHYAWVDFELDGGGSGQQVDLLVGSDRSNELWTMSALVMLAAGAP